MQIFLDMDGVLCDFTGEACRLHGRPGYGVTSWSFYEDWGLSEEEFWAPIHAAGHDFWANLPALEWCGDLLALIAEYDSKFVICSSPSRDPASLSGKLAWLNQHLGGPFDRYCFCQGKANLAAPGRLLIDDADKNIDEWSAVEGAQALIFSRPWNSSPRPCPSLDHCRWALEYFQGVEDARVGCIDRVDWA